MTSAECPTCADRERHEAIQNRLLLGTVLGGVVAMLFGDVFLWDVTETTPPTLRMIAFSGPLVVGLAVGILAAYHYSRRHPRGEPA